MDRFLEAGVVTLIIGVSPSPEVIEAPAEFLVYEGILYRGRISPSFIGEICS